MKTRTKETRCLLRIHRALKSIKRANRVPVLNAAKTLVLLGTR